MPYNSYFPVGYQPMQYYPQYAYAQPQQVQNNQPAQPIPQTGQQAPAQPMTSGIIWVQGEAGAKSYLVAPNTTVQLWDSERQTIYIKSADASGIPSIRTLDYTIREAAPNVAPIAQNGGSTAFATKDEVKVLADAIAAMRGDLDGLMTRPAAKPKKAVTEGE